MAQFYSREREARAGGCNSHLRCCCQEVSCFFSLIYLLPSCTLRKSLPGPSAGTRLCNGRSLPPLLPGGAGCLNTLIKADPELKIKNCLVFTCNLALVDYDEGGLKMVQGSAARCVDTQQCASCRWPSPRLCRHFLEVTGRERPWQMHRSYGLH